MWWGESAIFCRSLLRSSPAPGVNIRVFTGSRLQRLTRMFVAWGLHTCYPGKTNMREVL